MTLPSLQQLTRLARYADPGHATSGHSSHAGQRVAAVFLRVLHIWYYRGATLGWIVA